MKQVRSLPSQGMSLTNARVRACLIPPFGTSGDSLHVLYDRLHPRQASQSTTIVHAADLHSSCIS